MLTINLLPPEEKAAVGREELRLLIRFFGFAGAAVFIIGIVLLLPTYLTASFAQKEAGRLLSFEEEASRNLKVAETELRALEVKTALKSLRGFLAVPPAASPLLEEFLGESSGITLNTLNVKKDGTFALTARAATRRDLLGFEEKLRSSGIFRELSFPLSNLVRETSINFSLQGTLSSLNRL